MSVESWLPKLRGPIEQLCAAQGVPVGVPVAWVDVESGGRLDEVTSLDERGYFQIFPDESKDLGLDHQRLTTDSTYSLVSGFKVVNYYSAALKRLYGATGATYIIAGSEYHWRMVKLGHSMGLGCVREMLRDAVNNNSTISWDMFKSWCLGHDAEYLHRLKHAPSKWFPFVDRWATIGAPYGLSLGLCEGPAQPPSVG